MGAQCATRAPTPMPTPTPAPAPQAAKSPIVPISIAIAVAAVAIAVIVKVLGSKAAFVVAGGFDDYGEEGALGFGDMAATCWTPVAFGAQKKVSQLQATVAAISWPSILGSTDFRST